MNSIKSISIALGLVVLSGCASTGPIEFESFTPNENDSIAKTTMRLAGSNKFIDSKEGMETTRKVAGTGAMQITRLLMLDFGGLAQDAITNEMIEDEPLAEYPFFLVEIPFKDVDTKTIIEAAQKKLEHVINQTDFKIKDIVTSGNSISYKFTGSELCENIHSDFSCVLNLKKGVIKTINREKKLAYVLFQSGGYISASHIMSKYKKNDISLYIPQKLTYYMSSGYIQYVTKNSIVINSSLGHKFITKNKLTDGEPLSEFKFYGLKINNDKNLKTYYEMKPIESSVIEIDPNTPL